MSSAAHFLGIDLDEESRHRLAAGLSAAFEDHPIPGVRVSPPNWHITLRYLGPISPHQLDGVVHALADTSLGAPFRLRLDGLGAFPRPERAAVLWVGTAEGTEDLHLVRENVEEVLESAGLPREDRPFEPHLTLSRIRPPVDVSAEDGKKRSELKLDGLPAWDGLIAARGRLFLTMNNGTVVCFSGK